MKKVVSIEGVCDASSGGGAVKSGTKWQGVAFFRPWRVVPEGRPSTELLRVLLPARATSAAAMRDSRRTETVVVYRFSAALYPRRKNMLASGELRGRFSRVGAAGGTLAEADEEVAARLRVKDPVLGVLIRPPRADAFEGRLKLFGRSVPLTVDGPVERASVSFARAREGLANVPKAVAKKMLRLANEAWLDQPITERELLRRLKIQGVSLDGKGLRLHFSCGDTFTDHGIVATVTARGTLASAHLE
jgi:hypothetical protein